LGDTIDASKYYIFPQVSLASLVVVERGASSRQSYHNKIDRKTVDFTLFSRDTLAPRLVIELDDSSHDREDRKERDAFVDDVLARAGLPLLHVKTRNAYDPRGLAEDIGRILTAQTANGRSI
jgi:very-short-patch-repair endonuclease